MKVSSYFALACTVVSALAVEAHLHSSEANIASLLIPRRADDNPANHMQTSPKRAANVECPAIWTEVSKNLTGEFMTDGKCNDNARAAIRAAFHVRNHLCTPFEQTDNLHIGLRRLEHVSGRYRRMRWLSDFSSRVPS
jgi:hypothetical protein